MGDMAELDIERMYLLADDDYYQANDYIPERLTHKEIRSTHWSFNKKKRKFDIMEINKFYVGAAHIATAIESGCNAEWSHSTYEKAVEHAKAIMEREDKECAIIVKIVAVLRRETRPIRVEKV